MHRKYSLFQVSENEESQEALSEESFDNENNLLEADKENDPEELPSYEDNYLTLQFSNEIEYIYTYPAVIACHPNGTRITRGDLHGNALLLLYSCIREGLISLPKEDYAKIVTIYNESDLVVNFRTYSEQAFDECLNNIKVVNPNLTLLLIGDELADRGKNDKITLKLLNKLSSLIKLESIFSNHTFEYTKQLVHGLDSELIFTYQKQYKSFGASYYGLRKELKNNSISLEEAEKLSYDYLKNLKLLSYFKASNKLFYLYSHAPLINKRPLLNIRIIRNLAYIFNVPFAYRTTDELSRTIDLINEQFQSKLTSKENFKNFMHNDLYTNPKKYYILANFLNNRHDDIIVNYGVLLTSCKKTISINKTLEALQDEHFDKIILIKHGDEIKICEILSKDKFSIVSVIDTETLNVIQFPKPGKPFVWQDPPGFIFTEIEAQLSMHDIPFQIINCHGHEGKTALINETASQWTYLNTDYSELGKNENCNTGKYLSCSIHEQPTLDNQLEAEIVKPQNQSLLNFFSLFTIKNQETFPALSIEDFENLRFHNDENDDYNDEENNNDKNILFPDLGGSNK